MSHRPCECQHCRDKETISILRTDLSELIGEIASKDLDIQNLKSAIAILENQSAGSRLAFKQLQKDFAAANTRLNEAEEIIRAVQDWGRGSDMGPSLGPDIWRRIREFLFASSAMHHQLIRWVCSSCNGPLRNLAASKFDGKPICFPCIQRMLGAPPIAGSK